MSAISFFTRTDAETSVKRVSAGAVVSRLSSFCKLSAEEMDLLNSLARSTRTHATRTEIWNADEAGKPRIMVSGWACRQRFLGDGRRQIISFILPGDAVGDWLQPDLHTDASAIALTEVVTADAEALVAAAQGACGHAGLSRLLRLMASLETTFLHNHIVRLGRQTAYERMVHLMLEFHSRLHTAEMLATDKFAMPLTQETLADSLGLSMVHVNRTLMQMRRDGLLQIAFGMVRIIDMKLMRAVADWAPTKLDGRSAAAGRWC